MYAQTLQETGTVAPARAPARDVALAEIVARLPDDALATPKEAAAVTGYAVVTLRQKRREGKGPRFVMVEGRPRYRMGDLRDWMAGAGR